jgi:hypothetical protein
MQKEARMEEKMSQSPASCGPSISGGFRGRAYSGGGPFGGCARPGDVLEAGNHWKL